MVDARSLQNYSYEELFCNQVKVARELRNSESTPPPPKPNGKIHWIPPSRRSVPPPPPPSNYS
ncbi:hypothetical protein H5410_020043 [Solanum commersonii]|uniref:Uncharacterized protein n=1 Tax=Solanum commersonii TaxID=4109 RepID=A0A9J5Z7Z1_SOLCO|nr:hypothetical protein H5410_020043 [Solanum commersonii]